MATGLQTRLPAPTASRPAMNIRARFSPLAVAVIVAGGWLGHSRSLADELPKNTSKIERLTGKMLPRKIFDKPLPEQVAIMRRMMVMLGKTQEERVANCRARLLREGGLPADFKDLVKKGMNGEQIKAHYWGCPEFKEFWSNELGIENPEALLDELIRQSV